MTETFSIGIEGQPALTQPNPGGEEVYARSTQAADSAFIQLNGGGAYTLDAADGRIEVTLGSVSSLTSVQLSGPCAGDVRLFGEGEPAGGRITVLSRPVEGETLRLTLSGQTAPAYEFKDGIDAENFLVRCVASTAGSLDGLYFDLVDSLGAVRIWFTSGGVNPAPTIPPGGRLINVNLGGANITAPNVATAVSTAIGTDAALTPFGSYQNYLTIKRIEGNGYISIDTLLQVFERGFAKTSQPLTVTETHQLCAHWLLRYVPTVHLGMLEKEIRTAVTGTRRGATAKGKRLSTAIADLADSDQDLLLQFAEDLASGKKAKLRAILTALAAAN